jgi:hypothetical protein
MRRFRTLPPLALLLFALLALAGTARAQSPISPARYFAPDGYRTKEFTLVRTDGWFHLFYIRENLIPTAPTELSLGHAISRDLYTWAELDSILPVLPGTFEGTQIWAPHLMRSDGLWRMFYPAMRHDPANGYHLAQTITSATSPDLMTWTRRQTPLFDNSIFPWAYHDTTANLGMDCRDPFVWWDDIHHEWLMYVATRPASQPAAMVIGIAGSSDLEHWSDRGFVPLTLPNVSFSDVAESPLIVRRDATPLLFIWTTNSGQQLTYGQSNDPVTGWSNSARLRNMLGYTTTGWWASEALDDGNRHYFANVHDTWVEFWDLAWTGPVTFALSAPNRGQSIAASFDRNDVLPDENVRVEVQTVGMTGRKVGLSWVRIRGSAIDTLVASAWNLPDSVSVTPDSAAAWFAASRWLGDGRPCLLAVAPAGGGGTVPADTLRIGVPDEETEDPVTIFPEPVVGPLLPEWFPRLRGAKFTLANAPGAWAVEVYDVRGRLCFRGRAEAGVRSIEWHAGDAAKPGMYFARARAGSRALARTKFVVY